MLQIYCIELHILSGLSRSPSRNRWILKKLKKYSAFVIDDSMLFFHISRMELKSFHSIHFASCIIIQMSIWYNYRFCFAFCSELLFLWKIETKPFNLFSGLKIQDDQFAVHDELKESGKYVALFCAMFLNQQEHQYFHSITTTKIIYFFSFISVHFGIFISNIFNWCFGFEDSKIANLW